MIPHRTAPKSNKVTGRSTVGSGACGLGYGSGSLWVEDTYDSTVSRVSASTGKRIKAIPVGTTPYDATYGFGAVWATMFVRLFEDRKPSSERAIAKITKMTAKAM